MFLPRSWGAGAGDGRPGHGPCREYQAGGYYPSRDYRTDSVEDMASHVVLWLNLGAVAHVFSKALRLVEKRRAAEPGRQHAVPGSPVGVSAAGSGREE